MSDAQARLDDILTATTSYREELAREIMERVDLLEGQCGSMREAANVLIGREWVSDRSTAADSEELSAAQVKIERLSAEVKNLRSKLEDGEPLSKRLAEAEQEVQDARDLANKREVELADSLREVTRLEGVVAEARGLVEQIREAAPEAVLPSEEQLVGEVKMKDSGPKGDPRPIFSVPKANKDLYLTATERLNERFRVYLLEDGSILYRPTGIKEVAGVKQDMQTPPAAIVPIKPAEEEKPPPEAAPEAGPWGLARSPKPIAEMRAGEVEKEERLQKTVEYLQTHHSSGTFNASDLAVDMKVERAAAVQTDMRVLEERGVVERTGELEFPRAILAARQANPSKAGGRPAIQYRLAELLRLDPTEGVAQAKVRDFMVQHPDEMFSPQRVAAALEMTINLATDCLEALARRGSIEDKSPSADMRLFQYAGRPKEPGKAAEAHAAERKAGGGNGAGSNRAPVPGTGTTAKSSNKDVNDLINAAKKAGASVTHEASGHFAVTVPGSGKRILISATPSSPRSIFNDRARLRRAGLSIA
jgi:hypothetical protein